jgi:hypothetical protein
VNYFNADSRSTTPEDYAAEWCRIVQEWLGAEVCRVYCLLDGAGECSNMPDSASKNADRAVGSRGREQMYRDIRVGSWWVWMSAPMVESVGDRPRWYSYIVLPRCGREEPKL